MQYLIPKKRFLPILLIGILVAAAISFYILSRPHAVLVLLFPYVTAVFIVASLYIIGRYLAFGTLYRLGDEYTDLTLTLYRVYKTTSTPIASVELDGTEKLILLDKIGKKELKKKKKKKLGVWTANLIPDGYYALICKGSDSQTGYILLELNDYAKNAIEERIIRAGTIYSVDK